MIEKKTQIKQIYTKLLRYFFIKNILKDKKVSSIQKYKYLTYIEFFIQTVQLRFNIKIKIFLYKDTVKLNQIKAKFK